MNSIAKTLIACGLALASVAPAGADQLDDILSNGKLRCAVTLDFPPMGEYDSNNNPIGFDVDYCRDIAKALGVEAEIVDTPFADRIPALTSNRVDIAVASTSDTLERAKVVSFTIPYSFFTIVTMTREDTGIEKFEDLKGRIVGGTAGTYEGPFLEEQVKKWADPKGSYRLYQNQADLYLALQQGKIDAALGANTVAYSMIKSGKYPGLKVAGEAPVETDFASIVTLRQEQGLINYLNLFIFRQVRTGRFNELWQKYVGGETPSLTMPGVYR